MHTHSPGTSPNATTPPEVTTMSDAEEDDTRVAVRMPKKLRDDAKRNTEYGELSERVRELYREMAYGPQNGAGETELEKKRAELREVRNTIDDLRQERAEIDTEIQSYEQRATRLEERIDALEDAHDELGTKLEVLQNMLDNGQRMWPAYIKNTVDVDISTAKRLHQDLRDENPALPEAAFSEPGVHDPVDWTEVAEV